MSSWQLRGGVLAMALAAGLNTTSALAAGDATVGKTVFNNNCRACHQADKERNGVGPNLVGIVGRPAASVEKFNYSKGMRESGIVWDTEKIGTFVKAPRKFVKGTRMGFRGFKPEDEAMIEDLLAYLTDPSTAE